MNFMARVIGDRYHPRQNQECNEYPAKSSRHSQARLTAATTECQGRTRAGVLKKFASPLMPDECSVTSILGKPSR
jgi:hypothetical protein